MKEALILIDIQNDYFEKGAMELSGSDKAGENARLILCDERSGDKRTSGQGGGSSEGLFSGTKWLLCNRDSNRKIP